MKTILITGASGFIGQALCKELSSKYKIVALDRQSCSIGQDTYVSAEANIEDEKALKNDCNTYLPDVVIHCAGIAHQRLGSKKNENLYIWAYKAKTWL